MDILQRALRESLDRNAAETVRWTQYKEQHEAGKANIEEFQKSLEVDIMVPIGSKALMPGRLYHTNEIVVSHSGTYYSKCSAHKALEICQNRLNVAASRLEALEAEANLHRNQLELPLNFDAFSSQEIIETYDEEVENKWQVEHKKKMKEHKRREAVERQKLMDGKVEDDVIKMLEERELMEELENELEAISEEEDVETIQAIVSDRKELSSQKKRISHFNERDDNGQVSSSTLNIESTENDDNASHALNSDDDDDDDDYDDDDDDDIPAEIKEIEQRTATMTNVEKLKLFKAKLDDVQSYVHSMRPRTIEDISHKTDMMFLSDHLISAIETIGDELNCERYLNGQSAIIEASDDVTMSPAADIPIDDVPKQTKTILKKNKKNSFAIEDEVKPFDSREKPSKHSTKKISFASEDEVKSYDVLEEPIKISSTVIYDHGPVLNLNVVHSDAVFHESNEQSDVIRSPVDIYKQFAACTIKEPIKVQSNWVTRNINTKESPVQAFLKTPPQKVKEDPRDSKITEAKTEVKEMLDNMFGTKSNNEPDPLPDGNYVDAHQPKKRLSLFKQRVK